MAIGPVEFIVIGFPHNAFKGEIVPALQELVDGGIVNIIDAVFIAKDVDGSILAIEAADLPEDEAILFSAIGIPAGDLVSEEDIELVAEALDPGTSAALLVWENSWATRFIDAVRNVNGIVIDHQRIPSDIVEAAMLAAAT